MRKLFIISLLFIASTFCLFSDNLSALSRASSIILSWNNSDSDVYYFDIYKDNSPEKRLSADETSYTATLLDPETEYSFKVVAKDSADNELWSEETTGRTTSWQGTYRWVNRTSDNNNGKLRNMILRLALVKEGDSYYYEVYYLQDDDTEILFFPLFPLGSEEEKAWVKYTDNSVAAVSYRTNAELVNMSSLKPAQWRISSIEMTPDSLTVVVEAKKLAISLLTKTEMQFFYDGDVRKISTITTSDSSLLKNKLFKNPNPGEGDAIILTDMKR